MKRNKSRFLALVLGMSMVCASLAGCGNQDSEADKTSESKVEESKTEESKTEENSVVEEPQETVNIVWRRYGYKDNADEKSVENAINEYIEPLIGVTVTMVNSNNATPLDLSLAAGDELDIFWVSSTNLTSLVADGAAYNLTDVVQNYPELYDSMPETAWQVSTYNNDIYWIPVYKEMPVGSGVHVPTSIVEEYGWDLSAIEELEDIEPLLAELKADGYDRPYVVGSTNYDNFCHDDFEMFTAYAGVRRNGDGTVENLIESEEYMEYCSLMYKWQKAGYIDQSEASGSANLPQVYAEGETAFGVWIMTPDSKNNASNRMKYPVEIIPLTGTYVGSNSTTGSAYAINAKTEKIDACMKFMELLYTDQTLADLVCYGIEGTHYTRSAEGKVTKIADAGYGSSGIWSLINVMTPSLMESEADDKKEQYEIFNSEAEMDSSAGFRFDASAVEAETAAVNNVIAEYLSLLERGFYDPEEYIPKFASGLKTAGVDVIIAEMQTQYDAWRAAK